MTTTTATKPQKKSGNHLVGLYDHFASFAGKWQSPFLLLIRLYIGYQCAIAGFGHLHNFDTSVKNFQEWKVPFPHVSVAISGSTELIGGILLLIGFAARLISIPLVINFFVAMIQTDLAYPESTQKLHHLWDNQDIILKDTAFPFFATALIILIFGPGWLSVDGIIKFVRRKK
jgi:putative oxidoreductase